jgi:hypothetical protein
MQTTTCLFNCDILQWRIQYSCILPLWCSSLKTNNGTSVLSRQFVLLLQWKAVNLPFRPKKRQIDAIISLHLYARIVTDVQFASLHVQIIFSKLNTWNYLSSNLQLDKYKPLIKYCHRMLYRSTEFSSVVKIPVIDYACDSDNPSIA